jgi:hypothetical protein
MKHWGNDRYSSTKASVVCVPIRIGQCSGTSALCQSVGTEDRRMMMMHLSAPWGLDPVVRKLAVQRSSFNRPINRLAEGHMESTFKSHWYKEYCLRGNILAQAKLVAHTQLLEIKSSTIFLFPFLRPKFWLRLNVQRLDTNNLVAIQYRRIPYAFFHQRLETVTGPRRQMTKNLTQCRLR